MSIISTLLLILLLVATIIICYCLSLYRHSSSKFSRCRSNYPPCYNNDPIDACLPWVDSQDPEWLRLKHIYTKGNNFSKSYEAKRFGIGNIGQVEVEIAVMSVLKYAPWVRYIHILVHKGQKPIFLDGLPWLIRSRIKLVEHPDFFMYQDDIPTFNSTAIECNIHNITGLSNRFIYFNDDFYLCKPISPNMFFSGNKPLIRGAPVYNVAGYKILDWIVSKYQKDSYMHKLNISRLKEFGNKMYIWRYSHHFVALTKSMLKPNISGAPHVGNHSRQAKDSPPIHRAILVALTNGNALLYEEDHSRPKYKSSYIDVFDSKKINKYKDCHEICINQTLTMEDAFKIRSFVLGY